MQKAVSFGGLEVAEGILRLMNPYYSKKPITKRRIFYAFYNDINLTCIDGGLAGVGYLHDVFSVTTPNEG